MIFQPGPRAAIGRGVARFSQDAEKQMDPTTPAPEENPYPAARPVAPGRRRFRRLWRILWRLALAAAVGSVLSVALLRFVPPPVSGVMAERWLNARLHGRAYALDYRWTPRRCRWP
jgi:hypothetical protein